MVCNKRDYDTIIIFVISHKKNYKWIINKCFNLFVFVIFFNNCIYFVM